MLECHPCLQRSGIFMCFRAIMVHKLWYTKSTFYAFSQFQFVQYPLEHHSFMIDAFFTRRLETCAKTMTNFFAQFACVSAGCKMGCRDCPQHIVFGESLGQIQQECLAHHEFIVRIFTNHNRLRCSHLHITHLLWVHHLRPPQFGRAGRGIWSAVKWNFI